MRKNVLQIQCLETRQGLLELLDHVLAGQVVGLREYVAIVELLNETDSLLAEIKTQKFYKRAK
jgi:hypothetical protein